MSVNSENRGRGIATALLGYAEQEARKHGCKRLVLSTSCFQEAALIMYRKLGFECVHEISVYVIIRVFYLAKDMERFSR